MKIKVDFGQATEDKPRDSNSVNLGLNLQQKSSDSIQGSFLKNAPEKKESLFTTATDKPKQTSLFNAPKKDADKPQETSLFGGVKEPAKSLFGEN